MTRAHALPVVPPHGADYLTKLEILAAIPAEERAALRAVVEKYPFRISRYYLGLIDWSDPADPLRRIVVPRLDELEPFGDLDASNERAVTVEHGVQHKYGDTALLLCNEVCGAYCRYCFRKRLFMDGSDEASLDVSRGLGYIGSRPEISNVLLTGGDPLTMSTGRIAMILAALREIDHVRIIRLGTKIPAFNPNRILRDTALSDVIRAHSRPDRRIYAIVHFDHPRELTPQATDAIATLQDAGAICANQTPLLCGINDDAAVLATLFERVASAGCPQYYVFQGRPIAGNKSFSLPVVRAYQTFAAASRAVSGLAGRARFVLSHEQGKIEVVGLDESSLYARFHRARDPARHGEFFAVPRDEAAYWIDPPSRRGP